jgi:hypothetical protein
MMVSGHFMSFYALLWQECRKFGRLKKLLFTWELRVSQAYCWWCKSCGTLCCVIGRVSPDIWKECAAIIFRCKQPSNLLHGLLDPQDEVHYTNFSHHAIKCMGFVLIWCTVLSVIAPVFFCMRTWREWGWYIQFC